MSERVLMVENYVERFEGGSVTYVKGCYYIIDDPLRQVLVDSKKAVPESEVEAFIAEKEEQAKSKRAELLKNVPEVPGESPEQVAARLKVLNG